MLELYSFVDYFTIPPSFLSLYVDRTWIGECKDFINFWLPANNKRLIVCTFLIIKL